jgi:hypothetical protein
MRVLTFERENNNIKMKRKKLTAAIERRMTWSLVLEKYQRWQRLD